MSAYSHSRDVEVASASFVELSQNGERKFAKFFLISNAENLKKWQVTADSIQRRIRTFIGMPFVSEPELKHFGTDDMALDDIFKVQERYRAGTIIDVQFNPQTSTAHAIVEFENNELGQTTWKELMEGKAVYVSPAIAGSGRRTATGVNLFTDWIGIHLARVASPAYGVFHATIKSTCEGDERECVRNLMATASSFISSNDSFNIKGFSANKTMSMQEPKQDETSTATTDELKKEIASMKEDVEKVKTAFEALGGKGNPDTTPKPDPKLEAGKTTPVTDPITDPQNRSVSGSEDNKELEKKVASMEEQLKKHETKAASAALDKYVTMKASADLYANASEAEDDRKRLESATEEEIEKEIASIEPIIAKFASMNPSGLKSTSSRIVSQVASAATNGKSKVTSLEDLRKRGMI